MQLAWLALLDARTGRKDGLGCTMITRRLQSIGTPSDGRAANGACGLSSGRQTAV